VNAVTQILSHRSITAQRTSSVELQKVFRKCFKLLFNRSLSTDICHPRVYVGRNITESLGNVTVEGKNMERARGNAIANSLSEHV
jgi:hypothetical protein